MKELIFIFNELINKKDLNYQSSKFLFNKIVNAELNPIQTSSLLTLWRVKNECFDEIIYNYGGLDILICNAGAAWEGSISDIDEATFRKSMELNFYAHLNSCQRSLSIFHSQDFEESTSSNLVGGQILFNISKQAINPGPNFGSYGISKAALLALMRQISLEEGINKIRSNGINADRIKSGLLNQRMIKNRAAARGLTE